MRRKRCKCARPRCERMERRCGAVGKLCRAIGSSCRAVRRACRAGGSRSAGPRRRADRSEGAAHGVSSSARPSADPAPLARRSAQERDGRPPRWVASRMPAEASRQQWEAVLQRSLGMRQAKKACFRIGKVRARREDLRAARDRLSAGGAGDRKSGAEGPKTGAEDRESGAKDHESGADRRKSAQRIGKVKRTFRRSAQGTALLPQTLRKRRSPPANWRMGSPNRRRGALAGGELRKSGAWLSAPARDLTDRARSFGRRRSASATPRPALRSNSRAS